MALRRKVLIIVGGSLALLIVVLYLVSRTLMLNSYLDLEDQDVRRNIQRVLNNLQSESTALSGTASDWAYWDATYSFVQTGDLAYVKANINNDTFAALNVNLMVVMNTEGTPVLAEGYDLVNNQPVDVPSGLETYVGINTPLFAIRDGDVSAGIALVGDVPMLLVSRAVLQNGQKGPLAGTLIFGRTLDEAKIQSIGEAVELSLVIRRLNDPELPADFQAARAALAASQTVVVQPLDDNTVNGYTILNDINGVPALYLRVQLAREIYTQGQNSLSTFILGVLVVGITIIVVTLVLIERLVLARLYNLSRQMDIVTVSGNPTSRVAIEGDDELAVLGRDINNMLSAIEQSQVLVRQNEERLKNSLNELEASQSELVNNDHQLQMTVSRLEKQKRQLQRMYEFVHSTTIHMESSIQRDAVKDELMEYVKTLQTQLNKIDLETAEK